MAIILSFPFFSMMGRPSKQHISFVKKGVISDPSVKDQPPLQSQSQVWLTANEEGFSISEQFCQVAWLL